MATDPGDEQMTWRDLEALMGAVLFALMRSMTPAQRAGIAVDISAQSLAAESQGDARSAWLLRRFAEVASMADQYIQQNRDAS